MNLSILYKKLTNRKHTIGHKFILSLFVGFIGIISFCSATEVVGLTNITSIPSTSINRNSWTTIVNMGGESIVDGNRIMCISLNPNGTNFYIGFSDTANGNAGGEVLIWKDWNGSYICLNRGTNGYYLKAKTNANSTDTVYGNYFFLDELLDTEIPVLTSLECQTQYSLIPISDVNSNYCEINGLCPACPETTGTNRSSLFINNIQYPGAATIKITIPEEIERDQNTDEEETNIDVIGYGYDQDKMQQMVNTQYYKPTAKEMSGLMEKVADFLPLVAVALLIARIRRVIKKVF